MHHRTDFVYNSGREISPTNVLGETYHPWRHHTLMQYTPVVRDNRREQLASLLFAASRHKGALAKSKTHFLEALPTEFRERLTRERMISLSNECPVWPCVDHGILS